MLVRLTGGPGAGTVADLVPAVAIARIRMGTAIPVEEKRESGMLAHVVDGMREAAAKVVAAVRRDPSHAELDEAETVPEP